MGCKLSYERRSLELYTCTVSPMFLNLVLNDVMQTVDRCRDILSVITELISFVTGSPKRLHWFKTFQEEEESVSLVKFCPTRWTLKASSLRSVLKNYRPLILFLQEVASERSESSAKASGLAKALSKFQTYFLFKLMELVFSRLETVSSAQQKRSLMLDEAKRMIKAARESISELRHSFPRFWAESLAEASELEIEEPSIPASKKKKKLHAATTMDLGVMCSTLLKTCTASCTTT